MGDDEASRSLRMRLGLWLHRVLRQLQLLPQPPADSDSQSRGENDHPVGSPDLDDQWRILRTGFLTVSTLLILDFLVIGAVLAVVSPTEYEILLTTIGLLALNLIVTLWVLIRVRQSVVDSHFRV